MSNDSILIPQAIKLSEYFKTVYSKFEASSLSVRDHLDLAGFTIELSGSSEALQAIFLPSLAHLKIQNRDTVEPQLRIWYADSDGLGALIPEPPFDDFNGVGLSEKSIEEGYYIYYQPAFHQVFLYSEELRLGIYWTLNLKTIPWWEPTFSFRIILHWWTKGNSLQLMHAGAVAVDQSGGWLIAGPSGSGKSSTCLTLLTEGLLYLGDDYVLVKTDPEPAAYTVYQTAKLEPDNLESRFPNFKDLIDNPKTFQDEKAIFQIFKAFPKSFLASVKLKGILLPRVNGSLKSNFTSVSPGKAVLGIAPTTLRHLPHERQNSYQKMRNLANSIPVMEWNLGTDKLDLVRSFLELDKEYP
jgi:hypothetical protein